MVPKQRVAHRMLAVKRTGFFSCILLKVLLLRDPFSRGGPHIGDVEILRPVVVSVKPANSHASAHIFYARLGCNIGESSIAVVSVKILAAKIVHYIQIGPAVAVVVAPSAAKTKTRVVFTETAFHSHITKRAIVIVVHHEIRWTVFRIMIG